VSSSEYGRLDRTHVQPSRDRSRGPTAHPAARPAPSDTYDVAALLLLHLFLSGQTNRAYHGHPYYPWLGPIYGLIGRTMDPVHSKMLGGAKPPGAQNTEQGLIATTRPFLTGCLPSGWLDGTGTVKATCRPVVSGGLVAVGLTSAPGRHMWGGVRPRAPPVQPSPRPQSYIL
jgi:hypothetical protein